MPLALAMALHCPSRPKQFRNLPRTLLVASSFFAIIACAYSDAASLELVQLLETDAKYTITVVCVYTRLVSYVSADSTQKCLLCLQEVGPNDT